MSGMMPHSLIIIQHLETEAGESLGGPGQPELSSKTLSKTTITKSKQIHTKTNSPKLTEAKSMGK